MYQVYNATKLNSVFSPEDSVAFVKACAYKLPSTFIKIKQAFDVGDLAVIKFESHSLKGSLGMVGADQLSYLFGDLETSVLDDIADKLHIITDAIYAFIAIVAVL